MNVRSNEEILYAVLLGALCVGGAIVGVIFGLHRRMVPWPTYFALTAVAFGSLAGCTIVGLLWIEWSEYDRGIRASVERVQGEGYVVRRSVRSDGAVVYQVKNYIIPDGSFTIMANRTPFRPVWPFVATMSLYYGSVTAVVSLISRRMTRRCVPTL